VLGITWAASDAAMYDDFSGLLENGASMLEIMVYLR